MDNELIFWIVAAIAGLITFGVLMALAKKESQNYVGWVGDWK